MMNHAEPPAGEARIAAAFFLRRALEQSDPSALLGRCQRGTKRGVPAADDHHIKSEIFHG
jgi:hypothetical protein